MLFNTLDFFFFLPILLLLFYISKLFAPMKVLKWVLICASLIFYGWNVPWFIAVLILSTTVTFFSVRWMKNLHLGTLPYKVAFYIGLLGSLGNLVFWKYTEPALEVINSSGLIYIGMQELILPLGISFYTFQQFTYVMDGRTQKLQNTSLTDYFLYVTFFPQLIIGPIVRHDELLPQLAQKRLGHFRLQNLIIGSLIFSIGFAKKILLADNLALLVDPAFSDLSASKPIGMLDAWAASLGYSLQLYFDFSGYSDMAIGVARMFGIRLPENFHSPLKATSIMDFWRRWHITLTRVTTRYVFSPVSIYFTRIAIQRQVPKFVNSMMSVAPASALTFVLIGFWHGVSWNFLFFGIIHSILVVMEYFLFPRMGFTNEDDINSRIRTYIARAITLFLIVLTLALFRSPSLNVFILLIESMFGIGSDDVVSSFGTSIINVLILFLALCISQISPNTTQIFKRYRSVIVTYVGIVNKKPLVTKKITWKFVLYTGLIFTLSLIYLLQGRAEFLYADF